MPTTLYHNLPHKPGIYQFFDAAGKLLYVGKSKDLRKRVASYFQQTPELEAGKQIMVPKIARVETTIVANELEALLLEATVIRRHQPPYNIMLKDDKSYAYIKISHDEKFPVISITRRVTRDRGEYFGPYLSAFSAKETLRVLKALFPFDSCTISRTEPCLEIQHGERLGPLRGDDRYIPIYQQALRRARNFLRGRDKELLHYLQREMARAAKTKQFERAAFLRDKIFAVTKILAQQNVISGRNDSVDVVGLGVGEKLSVAVIFQVRSGRLLGSHAHTLRHASTPTLDSLLTSFLTQYYSRTPDNPNVLIVPFMPKDTALLEQLTQARIRVIRRGRYRKLQRLSQENANDALRRAQPVFERKNDRAQQALASLARALHLPHPPQRIETVDISNFQGAYPVGSLVVFQHGQPDKSQYRKFAIRNTQTPNDVGMMKEVLERRFQRLVDGDPKFPKPDLLIVDGGKGQLHIAQTVVEYFGLSIPVASLAKREEEIYLPGQSRPVTLSRRSPGLQLVQHLRDEAHRFAIGYYRTRHAKATTQSSLDRINGIGPKTQKRLLQRFGSFTAIYEAADSELLKILTPRQLQAVRKTSS